VLVLELVLQGDAGRRQGKGEKGNFSFCFLIKKKCEFLGWLEPIHIKDSTCLVLLTREKFHSFFFFLIPS